MKTHLSFLVISSVALLILPGCKDRAAEEGRQAAAAKEAAQAELLKRMDADSAKAREAASKGKVPEPKPFQNPLLK